MENSNVLDPTGLTDSWAVLQEMVDSDCLMDVPPGYYYISRTIVISRPKIITMSQPLLQPFEVDLSRRDSRKPGANIPTSHTRIWTDQNINFFEIKSPQVYFSGGCLDAQKVIGWDKAAFYYPGICKDHNNRVNGWGGGAKNFLVLGNYLDMVLNKNPGGFGVYFDFENYAEENAYWTLMRFVGKAYGVKCGWFSSPRSLCTQWANTIEVDLEVDYSKQSIVNHSCGDIRIKSKHQARHVFATTEEAETSASIFSKHQAFVEDAIFPDFASEKEYDIFGGVWKNSRTLELHSESVLDERFPTMRSRAIYIAQTRPRTTLDGAVGFIPRQTGQKLFIPDLHDILYAHFKTAIITTKAYRGRNDLDQLTFESDGELSTDITLTLPENLFKWNKTLTSYGWNQAAVDNEDYAELVVSCAPISVRDLWVTVGDNRCSDKLQIITISPIGVVTNNIARKLTPCDTANNTRSEYFPLVWDKGQVAKLIVRFIGCSSAGSFVLESICGANSRHMSLNPLVCR
ncbi:MAG TPA: hypothetical protein DCS09_09930 [Porphyromonadaceae bacterium]|nr:hypothetical protein [Porphyromonadaceae bacterium]